MTPYAIGAAAALVLLLVGAVALGASRSEQARRKIGVIFRRTPRSKSADRTHYYKPYWSR